MRALAILLICGAMLCCAGLDTSSKWLGRSLRTIEIVWSRYLGQRAHSARGGPALVSGRAALEATGPARGPLAPPAWFGSDT